MNYRTCKTCREELPETAEFFYRHPHCKGGLLHQCKRCFLKSCQERYAASRETVLERQRDNRAVIREREAKYRSTHREAMRAKNRRWLIRHRELNAELCRQRYRADPEARKAQLRAWKDAHPEYERERTFTVNQRRRGAVVTPAAKEYIPILRRDPCAYCGSRNAIEIDHILAISRGGTSDWNNLTAACRTCNNMKRNLPLLTFMLRSSRR